MVDIRAGRVLRKTRAWRTERGSGGDGQKVRLSARGTATVGWGAEGAVRGRPAEGVPCGRLSVLAE